MRRIRFALDANDAQPVSFEWIFEGVVPAVLEDHEVHRARDGRRIDADIARYHHIGTAHGWLDVDGERIEFSDDTWVSTRDHSWGVRYQVGVPIADIAPAPVPTNVATTVIWSPILMTRAGRLALRPAHLLPTARVRRLAAHRAAGRVRTCGRTARALRRARSRARCRSGEPSSARWSAARDDERRHAPET